MTIAQLIEIIEAADRDGPLPHPRSAELTGLSGKKTVALLQRLAAARAGQANLCYAEVGVFQGLTMLSVALTAPGLPCIGIDDFSILDPKGENLAVVQRRIKDFGAANVILVNADYEAVLVDFGARFPGKKIGVYFVDGAHDYRSQLMGLMLGLPHLAEDAAVVIDDTNYAFVRRATDDFLRTHPDWRLVFDAYSPGHPANLDKATLARFEAGWLNGVHVLARDPTGRWPRMSPPLADDRALYVNDWLVHRHGLAARAPEALALAAQTWPSTAPFPDRNTHSEGLPQARFNRPR
jgi:hypothetical protein